MSCPPACDGRGRPPREMSDVRRRLAPALPVDADDVELGESGGTLHRAFDGHGLGTAGVGIVEALGDAAALKPAGDKGGVEAVAGAGRVHLVDRVTCRAHRPVAS